MKISKGQIALSKIIMKKLEVLCDADMKSTNQWNIARGLLIQYLCYGPKVSSIIDNFKESSPEERRIILKELSKYKIHMQRSSNKYFLYTDWSDDKMSYVLKDQYGYNLLWNSRSCNQQEQTFSSFLGELTVAKWSLEDSVQIWRGVPIMVCSDSKGFITNYVNISKSKDSRILRRAEYLLTIPDLKVTFTLGEFNKEADFMSRMRMKKKKFRCMAYRVHNGRNI